MKKKKVLKRQTECPKTCSNIYLIGGREKKWIEGLLLESDQSASPKYGNKWGLMDSRVKSENPIEIVQLLFISVS